MSMHLYPHLQSNHSSYRWNLLENCLKIKITSDHGFDSLVALSEDCVDLRGFCQGSSVRVDECELQTHHIFQHSLVREAKLKDKGIAKCIRMETEGHGSTMAACRLSVFCLRSRNILQMNGER